MFIVWNQPLQAHHPQRWLTKLASTSRCHPDLISENSRLNPGCCYAFNLSKRRAVFSFIIIYLQYILFFVACSSVSFDEGIESDSQHGYQNSKKFHHICCGFGFFFSLFFFFSFFFFFFSFLGNIHSCGYSWARCQTQATAAIQGFPSGPSCHYTCC